MADGIAHIFQFLSAFAFYYPLLMAYFWMSGGVLYYLRRERARAFGVENPPPMSDYPAVSILIPCFNEEKTARETVESALAQRYPNFEVIAINDGSADGTKAVLDQMEKEHKNLRVIHLAENQGKAMALRTGAMFSPHEFLVCIDADGILEPHATTWLMSQLTGGPRVGAVSGNPRVRNRSSLLSRIQVGEFSAIIGLLKRTQRIYGRLFTVSGAVCGFRKRALQRVGYWSPDMVTEDIDISWKLQLDRWDVRFEPNAMCWLLVPETLAGLWNQRLRWAQGGGEVLIRHYPVARFWHSRRMWPIYLEYFGSVCWAYSISTIFLLWALGKVVALPPIFQFDELLLGWAGAALGLTCLLQFLISLVIDSRYEKGIGKFYYWLVWYPVAYWVINVFTMTMGLPKAFFRLRKEGVNRARWESPDRGYTP